MALNRPRPHRHAVRGSRRTLSLVLTCGGLALSAGIVGCGGATAVPSTPSHSTRISPGHATVNVSQLFAPLLHPLYAYTTYVNRTLAVLRPQLTALQRAIATRNVDGAERAWLAGHLTWLRIGQDDGAYGAFGDLGRAIDGGSDGLLGGTASRRFTGFHRVELDLFRRRDLARAARDAAGLSRLVRTLTPAAVTAALPATEDSVNGWTLRPHEILEDALRDSLSENDDNGSGTDVASVSADVSATREILALLKPLIQERSPQLVPTAERELARIDRAVRATRRGRAPWREPHALSQRSREELNSAVDAALGTLAPISELMQIGSA
jgi:high-affinity iron transporter